MIFAELLGCSAATERARLSCLQNVSLDTMVEMMQPDGTQVETWVWRPTVDSFLPGNII